MVLVTTRYVLNSGVRDPDGGDDILDAYNSSPKAKVRLGCDRNIMWNVLMMYRRHIVCARRGVGRK